MIFCHKIFGKNLTSFYNGRFFVRTEAGDTSRFQAVYRAQNQRIIGSDNRKINLVFYSKPGDSLNVLGTYSNTFCIGCNTTIARKGIDFLHPGTFPQFLDNGVLSAAAAYY